MDNATVGARVSGGGSGTQWPAFTGTIRTVFIGIVKVEIDRPLGQNWQRFLMTSPKNLTALTTDSTPDPVAVPYVPQTVVPAMQHEISTQEPPPGYVPPVSTVEQAKEAE